ncbi:MAG: hypothetical protein ABI251_05730, partial [Mycobacteriaceae bacterium]
TPTVCNACPVKAACTTSNTGREMSREVDPWPHSEAGRFHRGISCTIALLSVLLPAAMLVAERRPLNAVIFILTIMGALLASLPLVSHFRHTPDGFPEHVPLDGQPNPQAPERLLGPTGAPDPGSQSLIPASRRSVYGSDRKSGRASAYARVEKPDSYATRWGGDNPKGRP